MSTEASAVEWRPRARICIWQLNTSEHSTFMHSNDKKKMLINLDVIDLVFKTRRPEKKNMISIGKAYTVSRIFDILYYPVFHGREWVLKQ